MSKTRDDDQSAIPLAMVGAGRRVRIQTISGGQQMQSRLTAMGFLPGVELDVIRTNFPGPVVVSILNSRVMLGRGLAQKIMVS